MGKKVKVLLLSPPPEKSGGIARWTGNILNHYKNKGSEDSLIELSFFPVGRKKYIASHSSFFFRMKEGIKDYTSIIRMLKKRIEKERPDVLHITSSGSLGLIKDLRILRLAKRYNIPAIIHFRCGRIPELYKKKNWVWRQQTKQLSGNHKPCSL